MSNWPLLPLKEFIEIKHGFAFKGQYFTDKPTSIVLVTPGNFAIGGGFQNLNPKWYDPKGPLPSDYILSPGSLIVTMTDLSKDANTLGYSAIIPDDTFTYLHNQRIGLVETLKPDRMDYKFLYFAMRSANYRDQIVAGASGTTVHHTSPGRIKDAKIIIPPLPIQRRIAEILGRLDAKIEVNRRINHTLEQMAQTLYKHWFVNYGPFQAGEFVESELGLIPQGWKVQTLSSLVQLLSGGTPSTKVSEYWDGEINWVAAKDVVNGAPFIMSTERTITPLGVQRSSTQILPPFTTIISARGTVGACGVLSRSMAMNQTNYGVRGKSILGDFSTYLLVLHAVTELKKHAYGTVFDTITRNTFDSVLIATPPGSIWNDFESKIELWFKQILNHQEQILKLSEIRDYLLPKLLSGEIPVEAAAETIEASS